MCCLFHSRPTFSLFLVLSHYLPLLISKFCSSPGWCSPSVPLSILDICSVVRITTNTNILIYMECTEGDILSVTIGYNYHVSHLYSSSQLLELFSQASSHLILLTVLGARQLFFHSLFTKYLSRGWRLRLAWFLSWWCLHSRQNGAIASFTPCSSGPEKSPI